MLVDHALRWLTESFGKIYVSTQDGASPDTSKATQKWCKKRLKRIWDKNKGPPSTPDLLPMVFTVWCILKSDTCSTTHSSTTVLKQDYETARSNLSNDFFAALFPISSEAPVGCGQGQRWLCRVLVVVLVLCTYFGIYVPKWFLICW